MNEAESEKIKKVAKQIQEILVANKMAMTPTISIGYVDEEPAKAESSILKPEPSKIIVPGQDEPAIITPENNVMNQADFMQP